MNIQRLEIMVDFNGDCSVLENVQKLRTYHRFGEAEKGAINCNVIIYIFKFVVLTVHDPCKTLGSEPYLVDTTVLRYVALGG